MCKKLSIRGKLNRDIVLNMTQGLLTFSIIIAFDKVPNSFQEIFIGFVILFAAAVIISQALRFNLLKDLKYQYAKDWSLQNHTKKELDKCLEDIKNERDNDNSRITRYLGKIFHPIKGTFILFILGLMKDAFNGKNPFDEMSCVDVLYYAILMILAVVYSYSIKKELHIDLLKTTIDRKKS